MWGRHYNKQSLLNQLNAKKPLQYVVNVGRRLKQFPLRAAHGSSVGKGGPQRRRCGGRDARRGARDDTHAGDRTRTRVARRLSLLCCRGHSVAARRTWGAVRPMPFAARIVHMYCTYVLISGYWLRLWERRRLHMRGSGRRTPRRPYAPRVGSASEQKGCVDARRYKEMRERKVSNEQHYSTVTINGQFIWRLNS